MGDFRFRLNPAIDARSAARIFQQEGRVHIGELLEHDAAVALAEHLLARSDWRHVINGGDKVFEIPSATYDVMDAGERLRIEAATHASARDGFQFRFDSIRVADADEMRAAGGTMLDAFARFLCSGEVLDLFGAIVGTRPVFVDAQGTRYRPGDFLTGHDDDVAGKNRLAAYVFGLTPGWRPEWGGLLLFHGEKGHVERGFTPKFNSVNLFRVPQGHSVSMVTPFAGAPRLAVTGWLRSVPA